MSIKKVILLSILLTNAVITCGIISSPFVSADDTDVIDEIGIEIPISCTMSGTGMTSHTASIPNGTYNSTIGETNIKVLCNDNSGFAVYAVGFTDDEYGKNVLSNSTLGSDFDISTGLSTSGGNSSWAMKLITTTSPTPTYPISIENGFDSFHEVPVEYTMVAKRTESTDTGTNAVGSSFKTTYQSYVSPTQPTGLYQGQVKYVLVHPNDHVTPDEFYGKTMQTVSEWGYKVAPGQTVTVVDERDGQEYTVARLADGKLWMTKNLRLDLSKANITASNTNNPTQSFLTAASTAEPSDVWCTDGNSGCVDQINYNISNNGNQTTDSDGHKYDEYGVYYNWYTATAGNGIYNASGLSVAAGDICPAGWHLPTGTYTGGMPYSWTGEYLGLIAALGGGIVPDSSNYNALTGEEASTRLRSNPNNFVYSGYYASGTGYALGNAGEYWTSTANYDYSRAHALYFRNDMINPGTATLNKYLGGTIRCVSDPIQIPITVHYGDHVSSMLIDGEVVNDGESVELLEHTTHTIVTIFDSGYVLDQWESSISSINGVDDGNISFKMSYKPETVSASAKQGLIMQEVTSWSSSVLDNQTVTAYDSRDNTKYTVARLADGKLWMTKNLRLDFQKAILTADNTNGATSAFLQEASTMPQPSNIQWCSTDSGGCADQIQYSTINIGNNTVDGQGHTFDEYGIYYNWYTATGGNGTSSTPRYTVVTGDICPAGWRLPSKTDSSSSDDGDFYQLAMATKGSSESYYSSANAQRFLAAPINMVLSGSARDYNGNIDVSSRGNRGAFWIASKNDVTYRAFYWYIGTGGMHNNNYGDGQINYGNAIRCLSTE